MYQLDPVKQPRLVFLILVLCAMIGPMSIDLFTPSLPAITDAFHTTAEMSQWTVSIFMLGFAISMLIVGPLSERFGHRRTLLGGYTLFLLATAVILVTDSIHVFIAARLIQAVFGCFGTALSRVIARDIYKGEQDIRILGMIGATMMVAPMVAPSIGGILQQIWDWHASFVLMMIMAVLTMLAVRLLPGQDRFNSEAGLKETLAGFTILMKDRRYMTPALSASLAFAGAFVFVVGAPFVLIAGFEISPRNYGIIFGLVMGAYILASAGAGKVTDTLGHNRTHLLAWIIMFLGAGVALLTALLTGGMSVSGFVTGIVIYEIGLGLFLPGCQARALAHLDHHAGTGAGMLFFLEMIVASAVSYCAGLMVLDNTLPLASLMCTLLLMALGISALIMNGHSKRGVAV
ncbi:multidrug effflux MFS transporter [Parendozoicomonas haliclonae]|uniref:Bcr/CflA family efflux transporter n=1 Tax=Parendozoicomonas haliclonae TaxID=1960125 RepID=A0A1X7AKI5_9GAMM|nr:multidrug effflux MFS transporter [Parendozoicomonas haliclonae]SMA47862.1 Bicyclomycin resistance protein [Parendozoicomonas haliclonae]